MTIWHVELERHWERLARSESLTLEYALRGYWRALQNNPVAADRAESLREQAQMIESVTEAAMRGTDRVFPHFNSEREHIAFGMRVFEMSSGQSVGKVWGWIAILAKGTITDEPRTTFGSRAVAMISETYLRPFHDFMMDTALREVDIAHSLQRFRDWALWFGAADLHLDVQAELDRVDRGEKLRREFEKAMQRRLFEWLHAAGFRLIAREPESPSGQADFVNFEVGGDRLPIEVKILDVRYGYGKAQLPKAKEQLEIYMDEHSARYGAIVLFDCTVVGFRLHLPLSPGHIPILDLGGGRRSYVYLVPAIERGNATEQKRSAKETIVPADFDRA